MLFYKFLLEFTIIVSGPAVANIAAGSRLNYKYRCPRDYSPLFDVSHKGTFLIIIF
jgi:hypothetical protein